MYCKYEQYNFDILNDASTCLGKKNIRCQFISSLDISNIKNVKTINF